MHRVQEFVSGKRHQDLDCNKQADGADFVEQPKRPRVSSLTLEETPPNFNSAQSSSTFCSEELLFDRVTTATSEYSDLRSSTESSLTGALDDEPCPSTSSQGGQTSSPRHDFENHLKKHEVCSRLRQILGKPVLPRPSSTQDEESPRLRSPLLRKRRLSGIDEVADSTRYLVFSAIVGFSQGDRQMALLKKYENQKARDDLVDEIDYVANNVYEKKCYDTSEQFFNDLVAVKKIMESKCRMADKTLKESYQCAVDIAQQNINCAKIDLRKARICAFCVINYYDSDNLNWFTAPCENPHSLVWAKSRGHPYWPAKVLAISGSGDDRIVHVQYFGQDHTEDYLPVRSCYEMTEKYHWKLDGPRLKEAIAELRRHIGEIDDNLSDDYVIYPTTSKKQFDSGPHMQIDVKRPKAVSQTNESTKGLNVKDVRIVLPEESPRMKLLVHMFKNDLCYDIAHRATKKRIETRPMPTDLDVEKFETLGILPDPQSVQSDNEIESTSENAATPQSISSSNQSNSDSSNGEPLVSQSEELPVVPEQALESSDEEVADVVINLSEC